uniref:Uncharacterized protein n=1 Tax=virus sp. ctE0n6 TaxID=2827985 RepID=A0A8S5RF51_9VIRU|nr:MAG TPA: hypothetical protein [virus sp. ctE0n6]
MREFYPRNNLTLTTRWSSCIVAYAIRIGVGNTKTIYASFRMVL